MQTFGKLLGCLVLLGILWGCEGNVATQQNLVDFVPNTSKNVLKIHRWEFTQNEFLENSLLQQLPAEPYAKVFSTYRPLFQQITAQEQVLLCLSPSDSLPIFTLISKVKNLSLPKDSLSNFSSKEEPFEKYRITTNQYEGLSFFETIKDSIVLLSNSKENLQQILKGNTQQDPSFLKAFKVKNQQGLIAILQTASLPSDSTAIPLASYTAVEMQILPNGLTAKGVMLDRDSLPGRLSLFKGQIPQIIKGAEVIPITSEKASSFTISNLDTLKKQLQTIRKDSVQLHPVFETTQEVVQMSLNNETVTVLRSLDVTLSMESLAKYLSETTTYRETARYALAMESSPFESLVPWLASTQPQTVFAWEDFIFFTETEATSETLLNALSSGAVLANSPYYEEAAAVLPQAGSWVQYNLKGDLNGLFPLMLNTPPTKVKNYPLAVTQLIYDRDFAHVNIVAKEQSGQQPSAGLVQQLASVTLEADVLGAPQFFTNHYTYGKDIVVQDVANTLYLISASGKILWKKKLNGPILGSIHEVDLLKNGKKQMAFTTPNTLYVLDRKGNAVAPFPKQFKDEITQGLSVFDYDNNRRYRFLVTQQNKVFMYDGKGKNVSGFTFDQTRSPIVMPPQHLRIGNKDYITIAEENGKLNILSRTGKSRVNVTQTFSFADMPIEKEGSDFVVITKDHQKKSISQNGKVSSQSLDVSNSYYFTIQGATKVTLDDNLMRINGKLTELPIGIYSKPAIFTVGKKIYIAVTELQEHKVYLYDKAGELLSNFPVYGTSVIDVGDANKNGKLNVVVKGNDNEIILYQAQ